MAKEREQSREPERPAAPTLLDQLAQQAIALHVSASALVAQTEALVMAVRSLQVQMDSIEAVSGNGGALTRDQLLKRKGRPSTFGEAPQTEEEP